MLLELQDLTIDLMRDGNPLRVVDGVSFQVRAGEVVALVGESGAGKSLTALAVTRLLPVGAFEYRRGAVLLDGRDVLGLAAHDLQHVRGGLVGYVFQEPGAALNPVMCVGSQVRESLRLHQPDRATKQEVIRLLERVGIPAATERYRQYAHQMSGGMQQRVMIAMALASEPKLLIADEPTTALDVTIQAQIVSLLKELRGRDGMSILLVTHNFALVNDLAEQVVVMYAGQVVEEGPAASLLSQPFHPYTQALLKSVPRLGTAEERLASIPGGVPEPGAWPEGCRFHPRCERATADCATQEPTLVEVAPRRRVRCPFWRDRVPGIPSSP